MPEGIEGDHVQPEQQGRRANAVGIIAEKQAVQLDVAERRLNAAADLAGVPPRRSLKQS